jgi:hypothetical protein
MLRLVVVKQTPKLDQMMIKLNSKGSLRQIKEYLAFSGRSPDLEDARGRATARLHELDELMILMKRSSALRPALDDVRVFAYT